MAHCDHCCLSWSRGHQVPCSDEDSPLGQPGRRRRPHLLIGEERRPEHAPLLRDRQPRPRRRGQTSSLELEPDHRRKEPVPGDGPDRRWRSLPRPARRRRTVRISKRRSQVVSALQDQPQPPHRIVLSQGAPNGSRRDDRRQPGRQPGQLQRPPHPNRAQIPARRRHRPTRQVGREPARRCPQSPSKPGLRQPAREQCRPQPRDHGQPIHLQHIIIVSDNNRSSLHAWPASRRWFLRCHRPERNLPSRQMPVRRSGTTQILTRER